MLYLENPEYKENLKQPYRKHRQPRQLKQKNLDNLNGKPRQPRQLKWKT